MQWFALGECACEGAFEQRWELALPWPSLRSVASSEIMPKVARSLPVR